MGFPVGIHWWFWLTMFLLGGGASGASWQISVLFMLAAFLSVMVHEIGHALAGPVSQRKVSGRVKCPAGQFTLSGFRGRG